MEQKAKKVNSKFFLFMIPMFILMLIGEYAYPCLSTDQFNCLMPYYMENFGWTAVALSNPVTMGRILGIPLTFLCGIAINKFGAKKIFTFSLLMYGVAEFMITFAKTYWVYYVSFCILGIIGTWILMSTFSLCNNWFRKWRGTALGLVTAISPISSVTIIAYMTNGLKTMGFQWTYGIMAGVMVVAAILSVFLVKATPEEVGCFPDGAFQAPPVEVLADEKAVKKIGLKQIFRHKEGWLQTAANVR